MICGGIGISDAFYCKECVQTEKDVSWQAVHALYDAQQPGTIRPSFLVSCAEGRLPENHQHRSGKNGHVLRKEKVRVKEKLASL